jgi:hypothetical protein
MKTPVIAKVKTQLERLIGKRLQLQDQKSHSFARNFEAEDLLIQLLNSKVRRRTSKDCSKASTYSFNRQPEPETAEGNQKREVRRGPSVVIRHRNAK